MSNTHLMPDTMYEQQCIIGDLLSPILLATTLDVPVPPSLTLPAFATSGYVRAGSPSRLVYVNQSAMPVTLAGSDGLYWLALHKDVHTPVTDWSRQAGSHYLWRVSGTLPSTPDGAFIFASVTVAGGVVTTLPPVPNPALNRVAYGGTNGQLAYAPQLYWDNANTRLGIGTLTPTMTLQVEGGIQTQTVHVADRVGDNLVAYSSYMNAAGGTNRWHLYLSGTAPSYIAGALSVNGAVSFASTLNVVGAVALGSSLSVAGATTSPSWAGFTGGVSAGAASAPGGGRKLDVIGDAYVSLHTGLGAVPLPGQYHVNAGSVQAASLRSSAGVYAVGGGDFSILNVRGSGSVIAAYCGIGRTAASGWGLAVSNCYADGQVQANDFYARAGTDTGTLNVRGTSYFGSLIGAYYAADPSYWLRIPSIFADTVRMSGGSVDGTLTVGGSVNAAAASISGNATVIGTAYVGNNMGIGMAPVPSVHLSLSGSAANKVGGGVWGDVSNQRFKRNIAPIADALGLLLAQQGRVFEYAEETRAALLPGPRYGFIAEEVTIDQWKTDLPQDAGTVVAATGFESLCIEALRELTQRIGAIESALGVQPCQ